VYIDGGLSIASDRFSRILASALNQIWRGRDPCVSGPLRPPPQEGSMGNLVFFAATALILAAHLYVLAF
jgi:hypothetical protein